MPNRNHRRLTSKVRLGLVASVVLAALALPSAASAAATATTLPASDVTQTTAGANAIVNPQGVPTTWRFEWATNAFFNTFGTYSNATPDRLLALTIGSASVPLLAGDSFVATTLTGLSPGTKYHYRVVATQNACHGTPQQNSCPQPPETTFGNDVTFKTLR